MGDNCDVCKRETFYLSARNEFGCIDCWCNKVAGECQSSRLYRTMVGIMECVPPPPPVRHSHLLYGWLFLRPKSEWGPLLYDFETPLNSGGGGGGGIGLEAPSPSPQIEAR